MQKPKDMTRHLMLQSTMTLFVPLMALTLLLQACGGPSQNRADGASDLPTSEAHGGPLRFTPALADPDAPAAAAAPQGAPEAATGTTAPTDAPAVAAPSSGATGSARVTTNGISRDSSQFSYVNPQDDREANADVLCKDSHRAGFQNSAALTCPRCQVAPYTQERVDRPKLDILIVADTSPSIITQRVKIAAGLEKFISQLPSSTDYRIAVMPAHSDRSYDESKPSSTMAGKINYRGGGAPVLNPADFRTRDGRVNMAAMSRALVNKLEKMEMDKASDGGELGLYSLNKGITSSANGGLLEANRALGFFRPNSALAVIFVSDENDICSYGVNYPTGVVPHVNVNDYKPGGVASGLTVEEKANKFYCRDAEDKPTVTSRSVFLKLRDLQRIPGHPNNAAMPLLISGIVYTDKNTIPPNAPAGEAHPEFWSEKEMGYGYLDIINDNQGVPVDIAKENFDEGLSQIGRAAAIRLQVKTEFKLPEGAEVDPNTICVVVNNAEATQVADFNTPFAGVSYYYEPSQKELRFRNIGATPAGQNETRMGVFYCEPPTVFDASPELIRRGQKPPTSRDHYRNLPVPAACKVLKSRIDSGAFDNLYR